MFFGGCGSQRWKKVAVLLFVGLDIACEGRRAVARQILHEFYYMKLSRPPFLFFGLWSARDGSLAVDGDGTCCLTYIHAA